MDEETLKAYKKMGEDYLESIDPYVAEEIEDFMEFYPKRAEFLM